MLANLESVFKFALEKVGLTTIALHEDVFGLHDALIGGNDLYSLRLFVEPGHVGS
jgi:hypothetical protein